MSSDILPLIPKPIFAYDIFADGRCLAAPDAEVTPVAGALYRWLHLDLADGALESWAIAHLPRPAARALLAAKTRPRAEAVGDGVLLTMRGINLNDGLEQADMVSLRLWITPTLVITVRRLRVFTLKELRDDMRAGDLPQSPIHLVSRVCASLTSRIETAALSLDAMCDDFEDTVYDLARDAPANLPRLRREVIKMRRHLSPLAAALRDLSQLDHPVVEKQTRPRLREIANRARHSLEELSEVHERLTALADHLDMVQGVRLEQNGYRLTVAAAVFLPLSFLTGLFGVNVAGMPGLQDPSAFWWLTGASVVLALILTLILRLIRWL